MEGELSLEPVLSDYQTTWKNIFMLTDPSMNTSQVEPTRLGIPHKGRKHTSAEDSKGAQVTVKKDEVNLLDPTLISKNEPRVPVGRLLPPDMLKQEARHIANSWTRIRPRTKGMSEWDNITATNDMLSIDNFWIFPIKQSISGITFRFVMGEGEYKLMAAGSDKVIMTAQLNGTTRQEGVSISCDGQVIAEGIYNGSNRSFSVAANTKDGPLEAAAALYLPSFVSENSPRLFNFLIPGLKKSEGTNRMFAIPFSKEKGSGLILKFTDRSKEVVVLKTRDPPILEDGSRDMTFGCDSVRVPMASRHNFELYYETKKYVCGMAMQTEGEFFIDITYPFSPLQGFIAALASAMPV